MSVNATFKSKVVAREPLLGAFFKTPHPILVEVMARAGFDYLVVDAEHAPFGREAIDTMMIAGRAVGMPLVVRVPARGPDWIGYVLDAGAAGIMVPHVNSRAEAEDIVRSVRYGPGQRGFAGTTRAAHYAGRSLTEQLSSPEDEVTLICQIEEPEGAANAAEIASVEGVDALFVGRADLAVATGHNDFFGEEVVAETLRIMGLAGAATGLYCAPTEDLAPFADAGGSLFVVGSEHTLITTGGAALRARFDAGS